MIDLACELIGRAMQVLTRAGVRQRYGNMSSATIVFILEELMRSQEAMCGSLLRRNSAGTDMSGTKGADGST